MKIGFISDIHIDINQAYPIMEVLVQKSREKKLDCLVIAGDISNHITTTLEFFERLLPLAGIPVYFVPGNHDMWDQEGMICDSHETYRRYQAHPSCLVNRSIDLGDDWVLLGDIGWYDYTLGHPGFSHEEFARRKLGERTWMDSIHVRWNQTDEQVHAEMLARMEAQLFKCRGKKCIIVTHMVTNPAFIVSEDQKDWNYFNAFLGSGDYSALFVREHVKLNVMGHVHYRKRVKISGVDYICSCLNYHTQWMSDSPEKEIESALTIIETVGGIRIK
ncbi:MAG: metallophosphoesterase [Anaerocolumna sp.]